MLFRVRFSVVSPCVLVLACMVGLLTKSGASEASAVVSKTPLQKGIVSQASPFRLLPSSETGISAVNRYDDPTMWGAGYNVFAYGAIGSGVAAGDFDGDGKTDLFVVEKAGIGHLYRNLGNWKFEDVTAVALPGSDSRGEGSPLGFGPWSQGAVFADVNNDGLLDLYVSRIGAPNLLYMNRGGGRFREEAGPRGLALLDASGAAAFCDYDRDGWLDVYVQTNLLDAKNHPLGQRDRLYHNRGDGTFEEVTDKAGISGESCGHAAVWWDYDGDGWSDLYVSNDYGVPDCLYRNNHDGTFTNRIQATVSRMPYYAMGADSGDISNDGLPDLLVADMAASNHERDMRGMAPSRVRLFGGKIPTEPAPQSMQSALYRNTGSGTFEEVAAWAGVSKTDWTWSVLFGDLDNDGFLDLQITNGMVREFHNADLLEKSYAFENPDDQRAMVKALPVMNQRSFAFRNRGDGSFEDRTDAWALHTDGVAFGAALADFDNDGRLDVVCNRFGDTPAVFQNIGKAGNALEIKLRGNSLNRYGVGATLRIKGPWGEQSRRVSTARGYLSGSDPKIHFGLGDVSMVESLEITWANGTRQTVRNLEAGFCYEIAEIPDSGASLSASTMTPLWEERAETDGVAFPSGSEALDTNPEQPLLPFLLLPSGPRAAAGDLDGDGQEDLWRGAFGGEPGRFLFNHQGKYAETTYAYSGQEVAGALFDFDGDGKTEWVVCRADTSVGSGRTTFRVSVAHVSPDGKQTAISCPAFEGPVGAFAPVRTSSGECYLFVGGRGLAKSYPVAPPSALWRWAADHFEDVTDSVPALKSPGLVRGAVFVEEPATKSLVLYVALEWDYVRAWKRTESGAFDEVTDALGLTTAGKGLWHSLGVADLNGDGIPDLIVGNRGLNTRFRATEAEPAHLYYVTSAATKSTLLVEATFENGRGVPVRTRGELGRKLPEVLKRFPGNDQYAKATVQEVLGAERFARAKVAAATQLESGVFLSGKDGRFTFQAFPSSVQISPLVRAVVVDVNGDGIPDVVGAQNEAGSFPRFDGGSGFILKNDGAGHFTRVPIPESGLNWKGLAGDLVLTHRGDTPTLFIPFGNEPTQLLQLRGHAAVSR